MIDTNELRDSYNNLAISNSEVAGWIPNLLDEIDRLREALNKYANRDNWSAAHESPYADWWQESENGYAIAEKALEESK